MKDFFAYARFQMALPGSPGDVAGAVIVPSGIPMHTVMRRKLSKVGPHLRRRFLDPQLYLATLNASTSRNACANLASYGWFPTTGIPSYDSSAQTQADWKQGVLAQIAGAWPGRLPTTAKGIRHLAAATVSVQATVATEGIILPSPLTTDPTTNYNAELLWLDTSIEVARQLDDVPPLYATVAISDTALRGIDPWENDLIELLLDQVTARSPDGVYLVLEQANENGYYCTHHNTVGALLRIVHSLGEAGIERIVVSGAGVLGLLLTCVSASTWSAGWYRGERRLKIADFEDQMGLAVPTYYSHPLATDIHTQSDLDRIVSAGMLQAIADDTNASQGLLRALRNKRRTASVPDWEYRKSNVGSAREHFLASAVRETATVSGLDQRARLRYAYSWLSNAERLASALYRVGSFNPRTELNHQSAWLRAYTRFLKQTGQTA